MPAPLTEDAYCEARARYYLGDDRVRDICDTELEAWIKAERAEVRALLDQVLDTRSSLTSVDVLQLVLRATTVYEIWRSGQGLSLTLSDAMRELRDALRAFEPTGDARARAR